MNANTVPELVITDNFQLVNKIWIEKPYTHIIYQGLYWGCRADFDAAFFAR